MPQKLHVEEIDTVGFVDTGANQLADVVIWKRAAEEEKPMTDTESGALSRMLRAVGKALKWSAQDVEAAVTEAATIQQEVGKMSEGFDLAALPDEAQQAYRELEERVTAAETAQVEAEEKLAEVEKAAEGAEEDVLKGVSDEVAKRFEELEKRAEAAEEIAKAERTARQRAEFAKMAEEELDQLQGEPEEKVDVLAAVHELPEEARNAVLGMLRSANELASEAEVFKSAGREGKGTDSDVYDQIAAKANKLVDDGAQPTFEQAFSHVMQNDVELAKAYRDERKGR